MNQRTPVILAALASLLSLFLVVACSDDTTAADASVTVDKAAPSDKAVKDGKAVPDLNAAPDGKVTPDSNVVVDSKVTADLKATPDLKVSKDQIVSKDQTVADAWAAACVGVKCVIQDDCCVCKSRKGGTTVPVCPTTNCKQNTCGAVHIKKPTPYCLKGQCLLYEAGTACKTDADCKKTDNCCDCLALPVGAGPPPCTIKSCFVNTCVGYGLTAAQPMCLAGVCKLRLP